MPFIFLFLSINYFSQSRKDLPMSAKRILPAAILLLAVLSPCLLSQDEAPEAVVAEESITTDPAALDALK